MKADYDTVRTIAMNMRARDFDEMCALSGGETREEVADHLAASVPAFQHAFVMQAEDGEPMAIWGWAEPRRGVAGLLFFATDRFYEAPLSVCRFLARQMDRAIEANGYHRVECATLADYGEVRSWLETMGLQKEGVLRGFGVNKEDFIMYARVA